MKQSLSRDEDRLSDYLQDNKTGSIAGMGKKNPFPRKTKTSKPFIASTKGEELCSSHWPLKSIAALPRIGLKGRLLVVYGYILGIDEAYKVERARRVRCL